MIHYSNRSAVYIYPKEYARNVLNDAQKYILIPDFVKGYFDGLCSWCM